MRGRVMPDAPLSAPHTGAAAPVGGPAPHSTACTSFDGPIGPPVT